MKCLIVVLINIAFVDFAAADDSCGDVLAREIGNRVDASSQKGFASASNAFQCSQSAQSASRNNSAGGKATYGAFSAKAAGGSGSQRASNSNECRGKNAEQQESAFIYYSQLMYSDAINAWRACITSRQQLSCWAEPTSSETSVILRVRWGILGSPAQVTYSRLQVGAREVKSRFVAGSTLNLDESIYSIDRKRDDEVSFVLEAASPGQGSKTCLIFVPAAVDLPRRRTVHQASWAVGRGSTSGTLCECVDAIRPKKAPGANGNTAYPVGAKGRFLNRCPNQVKINLIAVGATDVERLFATVYMPQGDEAQADAGGKTEFHYYVENCPGADGPVVAKPATTLRYIEPRF